MTQVARAFGQPFMRVWREPYHETLFAFAGLVQRERIEALADHAQRVRDAMRMNAAFAAPKALDMEQRELVRELRRAPGESDTLTREQAQQKMDHILAQFAGKTMVDVTPWQ